MWAILKELQCKRLTPHITAAKEKCPQPQRVTCCHPSLGCLLWGCASTGSVLPTVMRDFWQKCLAKLISRGPGNRRPPGLSAHPEDSDTASPRSSSCSLSASAGEYSHSEICITWKMNRVLMRTCWEAGRVVISGTLTAASKRGMVGCVSPLEKMLNEVSQDQPLHCFIPGRGVGLAPFPHICTFLYFFQANLAASCNQPNQILQPPCRARRPLPGENDPGWSRLGMFWAQTQFQQIWGWNPFFTEGKRKTCVCFGLPYKKSSPLPTYQPASQRDRSHRAWSWPWLLCGLGLFW